MTDPQFKVPQTLPQPEKEEIITPVDAGTTEKKDELVQLAGEADMPCPPAGVYTMDIVKNGTVISSVQITKPVIRFGRARDCDFPMDHPSISRYHAVMTWRPGKTKAGTFFLKDLNSTHGTFVGKTKVPSGLIARLEANNSVLKFGGSTRYYTINSTIDLEEDEENTGTVSQEAEAEVEFETDPEVLYEQFVHLVRNPVTIGTKNEHVFSENPHRVLQQWFEREGLEFEYNVTQQGTKFKCSVDIPVEGRDVTIEGTELQPRKKDAIDHVCLIACRVLDQTQRLYPWQNSSRRTKKRVHDSDDEDDDMLDETQEVRHKKKWTSAKDGADKESKAETFDSLMDKWNDCNERLSSCKAKLVTISTQGKNQASISKADGDEEQDSLDSYMNSMTDSQSTRDARIKQSQIKLQIKELEKKQRVYELLMKAAKSISLPPPDKKVPEAQVVEVKEETPDPDIPDQEMKQEEEQEKEDANVKMSIKSTATATSLTTKAASVFSEGEDVAVTSTQEAPESLPDSKFKNPVVAKGKLKDESVKQVKKKAEKKKEADYEEDFVDWCPPVGQDGSGITSLNHKLGY